MIRLTTRAAMAGAFLFAVIGMGPARAQVSATDLLLRLESLENQVRQLTGAIEQLQYRNQQLETTLRKMQEENEFRFQELGSKGGKSGANTSAPSPPPVVHQQRAPQAEQPDDLPPPSRPAYGSQPPQPAYVPPPGQSGRRSDAFDPSQNPNAPGVPRQLGSIYASGSPSGAPASAQPATPLDLSGGRSQGGLPPPPPRNPNATGALATLPPSQTPRDEYDLAYGYLIRKDYDLADQTFRAFLSRYPNDRLADDAQYGLGESLFQRKNYREAANVFLDMTRKRAGSPRAPEALMRLGQSLAALNEKDMACGAFAEIGRKYARVSPTVKRTVAREQKRVGCQ
ncbi:MAG: tol-pal system protein YbgF [Xanthobacteraceae bacterium]